MNESDKSRLEKLANAEGDAGVLPRVLLEIVDGQEKSRKESRIITAFIFAAVLATLVVGVFF